MFPWSTCSMKEEFKGISPCEGNSVQSHCMWEDVFQITGQVEEQINRMKHNGFSSVRLLGL